MKILIIDDNKGICTTIRDILNDEGYNNVDYALTVSDGLAKIKEDSYDIVFLDVWLPDGDGNVVLREIKQYTPDVEVVMISGHATIEIAVECIRQGAHDFLEKPLSIDRIVIMVKVIEEKIKLKKEVLQYRYNELSRYRLVGNSKATLELTKLIERIARTNSRVLIMGENGTGKEHVAKLLHMLSNRAKSPFIEINCSAVPENLIESEMFGHEKGAFTDASARKPGKFEAADKGTLFLDEIGDMELNMQVKLLRVLETSEFTPIGSVKPVKSDFRLICATNKNLDTMVSNGEFREDLYYRINVFPIIIKPLRERVEDIPVLVDKFVRDSCSLNGFSLKKIDDEVVQILCQYDWPGNVRQLKNIIERMAIMADDDVITKNDIPDFILDKNSDIKQNVDLNIYHGTLKEAKDAFEKSYITEVLNNTDWNVSKASRILDIERTYLHRKIKIYDIQR